MPNVSDMVANKQASQKEQHDKKGRERQFEVNQHVLVENPKGDPKRLPGVIVERVDALSCKVKVDSTIWKWHIDQLLVSSEHTMKSDDDAFDVLPTSRTTESSDIPTTNSSDRSCAASTSRYPQRERHPPIRYAPSAI